MNLLDSEGEEIQGKTRRTPVIIDIVYDDNDSANDDDEELIHNHKLAPLNLPKKNDEEDHQCCICFDDMLWRCHFRPVLKFPERAFIFLLAPLFICPFTRLLPL